MTYRQAIQVLYRLATDTPTYHQLKASALQAGMKVPAFFKAFTAAVEGGHISYDCFTGLVTAGAPVPEN